MHSYNDISRLLRIGQTNAILHAACEGSPPEGSGCGPWEQHAAGLRAALQGEGTPPVTRSRRLHRFAARRAPQLGLLATQQ